MDKELLRVVIIATGLVVIMGMLLWTYLKNREPGQEAELFGNFGFKRNTDKSEKKADTDSSATAKKSARYQLEDNEDDEDLSDFFADFDLDEDDEDASSTQRFILPEIIQFSLVAKAVYGFNGLDLFNAFQIVGLEYGSLKIFERLDGNRLVDFGVASMVEPGIFPETHLDDFFCPGLVFFMQPAALGDAVPVFDDFVDTIKLMAIELDGTALDHERKPLTDATIELIRQSL
jgi:cell division protein ZipA